MAKKVEKKALKKGQATFVLIGEAKINDFTFKIDESGKNSDWVYNSLNLGVDCGNGNVVYSEMMGGYGSERDNVLYVHGIKKNDGNKDVDDFENRFQIAWEDRFDEDVLATIGEKCFITVGLEKDKNGKTFGKKFLSAYDAIEYIKENMQNGSVVNVKGELKYSLYNDNVQVKKEIKSIFLSGADDKTKYKAVFTQTVLLDKDSIGKLDKEKAVYPITCRVVDYAKTFNGKEIKQNISFFKVFELEVDKTKPENTKKFLDKILKVKKDITEISLEGDIVEGQSLVTVTEADIPDDIKELIEMGAYTMEEAISKCAVGGSKEKRLIIRRPTIKMVGDDENKTPVIVKTESQYTEEDLIFDFMFDDVETEKENKTDTKKPPFDIDKKDDDDSEDTSWLDALEND
jgi:hypothetical protein